MARVSATAVIDNAPAPSTSTPMRDRWEVIAARLYPQLPAGGWRGWTGPIAVTVLAAILRLVDLGRPHAMAFDETYYAKDALSLLLFGYERSAVKDADQQILASNGDPQSLTGVFQPDAAFVVHPPVGKWVIASGEAVFGATPFGWRIAMAILGIFSVLMIARIVRRLTRSNLLGTIAGLLLAIDGLAIVLSRTALLDNSLMFFVLAAFGFLLLDRDRTRRKLANLGPLLSTKSVMGPALWWRPWRIAAGISLGLACGVKWSGLYYVAGFGLLTVLWDVGTRRVIGVSMPWRATIVRDAIPAFISIVVIAAVVYVATWAGWFMTDGGWYRNWADSQDPSWIPGPLRSLWHYHAEAWSFHTNLSSDHSYEANPWGWPLQARPTSFFYESPSGCGADKCAQEVLALGNPLIWWAATLAMVHQAWRWIGRRDWRAGAVLCGFAAGWVPWLFFEERTIFEFYAIAFAPFMIMALTLSLGTVLGPATDPQTATQQQRQRRLTGAISVGGVLLLAVVCSWWFYPIWTAEIIPYDAWHLRMWFPSWV